VTTPDLEARIAREARRLQGVRIASEDGRVDEMGTDMLAAFFRASAEETLSAVGARSLAALHRAVEGGLDEELTCRALHLLARIGDRRSTAPLIARILAGDLRTSVREAAAQALGQLDGRVALLGLADAIRSDPDDEVRRAALNALGFLGADDCAATDISIAGAGKTTTWSPRSSARWRRSRRCCAGRPHSPSATRAA
jgi:HEAT repeat protein